MKVSRALCVAVLCFLSAFGLYGQAVTGSVVGTVDDESGAAVANAKVTLTNLGTEVVRTEQSNASGNYTFAEVPEGTYSVAVEVAGFKRELRSNIPVAVNATARIDVRLQPGNISQQIEVTAAPPELQADSAEIESSISRTQMANLPVGTNRNFQSLLNLVPGTTRATFQHSEFFNASSSLQTEVNGQLRMGNNYQIEGIDDNERTGLLQILIPPLEAIATVDVSTSDFDAALGRASGAVTNVILKSGTNEIHGSAYEFLQNSEFDARAFFNPGTGHITYNYFGGSIGGAIIKNKLFYFGDILRVADHEGSANLFTIPTQAQIAGNLSASTSAIYNPFTGNANGSGRAQFPGNVIPTADINPISAKLMALLPAPNVGSATTGVNNYFALLPYHKDTTSFDTKVDYNPDEADRVSVRLSFAEPKIFQAPAFGLAGGDANGAFQGSGTQRTYSGGINYNHIFSPSLISELRFGVAYYNNIATPSDYGLAQSTALGIPGINLSQITSGLVGIDIGQFYSNPLLGYSASIPWTRAEANIDVSNIWTKILGNHTLKFGGDLRRIRDALLQEQTYSPRGLYTFGAGQTALNVNGAESATTYYNNMASFLLDVPSQAGRDLATYFPAVRGWQFFSFIQDKWVVTPKLTLDLGVRWEYYPPFTPQFEGGFSNYDPSNNSLVIAGIGLNYANLGRKTYYDYFAPRFGAAYRLTDKTVLRAGFGISYTPYPDNSYAFNYPVRANNAYNPTGANTTYTPAVLNTGQTATFQDGFPAAVLPTVPQNGIITNAPTNQSYYVVPLNYKNPYVESWNIALERQLPLHLTLDVAYVGNKGVDTSQVEYNLNAGFVAGAGTLGQPEYVAFNRTNSTTEQFAPYSSMYNSVQVKLNRRFASGLTLTTSYTYGKGMGYQSDDDGGLDFYINQHRNWARNDFDRTHTFVQSYVYDLPFGPGKKWLKSGLVGNIFGNWKLNGVLTVMTGLPMTLTPSTNNLNTPGSTQTVNQVAPVQILNGVGPNSPWFSAASFAAPTGNGVFGNTGRNFLTGPGFFNLDASLFKVITVRERYTLELRGEAFAITNTPQFANPGTTLGSSNFGYITGTIGGNSTASNGNRVLQIGLKFSF